jgi:hypothetical protein
MPSAELFLKLLEEKDLVSDTVLQAARREIERSKSSEAVGLSLWLVQGQHITASQAERLLSAAAAAEQKTKAGQPPKREEEGASVRAGQAGKTGVQGQAGKPNLPGSQGGKPGVRSSERSRPKPADDEEMTFLDDDAESKSAPSKPPSPPATLPPPPATVPTVRVAATPGTGSPDEKATKSGSPGAKIGGDLDPLADTMKGPLDALIETEALSAGGFDDPLGGANLVPSARKKFKLSRFLKDLFRRNKSKTVRIKAEDPRQIRIIVISWCVAGLVMVGLLTTFWLLSKPASTEILGKADDAATARQYDLAIQNYDEFLKLYPKSPNINDVRWRRALAVFQRAEEQSRAAGDWTPAFEVAKTEIKELPKDSTDTDVMENLTVALGKIGEGLAHQAEAKPDLTTVGRVDEVLNMFDADLPQNVRRPDALLDEIRRILKPVKEKVASRRELDTSLEAIRAAVDANDVQAGYSAYRDLLKLYPELVDDARLTGAMKAVSAVQQKAVKMATQKLTATREERPSRLLAAMPLTVQPKQGALPGGNGKPCFAVVQGTAYGLDGASGKTLWRRFVALDPKLPAVTAVPLSGPADGDALLCDPTRPELLRVKGATGELVWRLTIPRPILAQPVQAGKWLLLLTKEQRLELIDVATGESPRYFQLPQAVRLPPVVDPARGLIFLTADQSNLLVLDDHQCRQVMHLGHEAGKIAAPPAIVGDFLLLAVNDSPAEAALHVFSIAKGGEGDPLAAQQTIRVPGSVATAPVALGKGAAVVTEQGTLIALDRNEPGNPLPFQLIASRPVGLSEKSIRYLASDGKTLWLAERQLTHYAVRSDERRIMPLPNGDPGMKVLQSPRIEGGAMFLLLERAGMPGLTMAAFDLAKNEAAWQTWLAAPLVSEPMLGDRSGKLTLATASGGLFRAPQAAWKRLEESKPPERPWEPLLTIDASRLSKPLVSLLPLPGEMYAMTGGRDTRQIVIYDPKEQDKSFRWLLTPREMSVSPGLFAGGLLTPCEDGKVYLLDIEARGEMAFPLPPALQGVNVWNWRTPVSIDDQRAVLCDGDKRLTVVTSSKSDEGQALTEVTAVTSKTALVSPLAVLGKVVLVADASDRLLSFELPSLAQGKSSSLGSRCIWGPRRLGKLVLAATEKSLFAVNEQMELLWKAPLGHGPLAGAPYLVGDEIYLSARSGTVSRIAANDGKELGAVDAGCPLGSGPLVIGSRVLVGGHEGSLLLLPKP